MRRTAGLVFVVAALLWSTSHAVATSSTEDPLPDPVPDQILHPDNDRLPESFGDQIAVSNDTLALGWTHDGPPPPDFDNEIVHIYGRSGESWTETQQLAFPNEGRPSEGDIALDGDWLAVGRRWAEVSGVACGSVEVFHRVNGSWSRLQTLTPPDCTHGQLFGFNVVLNESHLAVAAQDTVYAYTLNDDSWSLMDSAAHTDSLPGLALDDGRLAVAASGIFVYDLASGQLTDPAQPNPSGGPLQACSLALEGTRLAVGCPFGEPPGQFAVGAAFVFEFSQGTWNETAALAPVGELGHFDVEFGRSIALDGDRLVVGAPNWSVPDPDSVYVEKGAAYLYSLIDESWTLSGFYEGAGPAGIAIGSGLGESVIIDGELLVIADPNFAARGSVAIYTSPSGRFSDDDSSVFASDIEWAAAQGVTKGCNPPYNTQFCPNDSVTRGQMAAFLNRYLSLPAATQDYFDDDNGSTFEDDINRLAEADITRGCNPPANDRYCPTDDMSREEMAAFLVRALGLASNTHRGFDDVSESSTFFEDIGRLATVGITKGCNPPANTNFCPKEDVTRGQMAAFLHRASQD